MKDIGIFISSIALLFGSKGIASLINIFSRRREVKLKSRKQEFDFLRDQLDFLEKTNIKLMNKITMLEIKVDNLTSEKNDLFRRLENNNIN